MKTLILPLTLCRLFWGFCGLALILAAALGFGFWYCWIPAGDGDPLLERRNELLVFVTNVLIPSRERSVIHETEAVRVLFNGEGLSGVVTIAADSGGRVCIRTKMLAKMLPVRSWESEIRPSDLNRVLSRLDKAGFWNSGRSSKGGSILLGTRRVLLEVSHEGRYGNIMLDTGSPFDEIVGELLGFGGVRALHSVWMADLAESRTLILSKEIGLGVMTEAVRRLLEERSEELGYPSGLPRSGFISIAADGTGRTVVGQNGVWFSVERLAIENVVEARVRYRDRRDNKEKILRCLFEIDEGGRPKVKDFGVDSSPPITGSNP